MKESVEKVIADGLEGLSKLGHESKNFSEQELTQMKEHQERRTRWENEKLSDIKWMMETLNKNNINLSLEDAEVFWSELSSSVNAGWLNIHKDEKSFVELFHRTINENEYVKIYKKLNNYE